MDRTQAEQVAAEAAAALAAAARMPRPTGLRSEAEPTPMAMVKAAMSEAVQPAVSDAEDDDASCASESEYADVVESQLQYGN